jgi:parvulin-like peptidyl-prolyl isomerase
MNRPTATWLCILLICLICGGLSCGRSDSNPHDTVVIYLGEAQLTLAELQGYFRANLLELEDDGAREKQELDRVRSRLLDAYVEERLLLAEAERRGLQVEDWEIEAYLALDEPHDEDEEERPVIENRQRLARQRLLVQMLREGTILGLPPLEEEEVKRYADKHGERLFSGRRLRLRALLLGSAEEAGKVHTNIRRRRITFDEAVAAYETYPGQGRSLELSWESLSDEARAALDGLKPGRVSPPVEMQGSHYLFKVESWLDGPEQVDVERRERARSELQNLHRQQALEELFMELRERFPVRIIRRNLPFRYIKDDEE